MGLLDGLPPIYTWAWEWQWDGFAAVDPDGETKARQTLLAAGLTTYAREFAEDGLDWEEQFEQQAIEANRRKELGLIIGEDATTASPAAVAPPGETEAAADTEEAAAAGDVQGTALNGAQIASLVLVIDKLALGQYPPEAAKAIIQAVFPLMAEAVIDKIVNSLKNYKPPVPVETANEV